MTLHQPAPGQIFAYVDETGDRGFTARSSPYFTFAAVLVRSENAPLLWDHIPSLCTAISKPGRTKVKWMDLKHLERKVASVRIAALPVRIIYVCIPKATIRPDSALHRHDAFYNYAARYVVERISWFARHHQAPARIWFERVKGFDPNEVLSYLHHLRGRDTSIHWPALRSIQVDSPANVVGLTVSDHVAGAFDAATRRDPGTGLVEDGYLQALRPRIYRGRTNQPMTYGFKILGDPGDLATLPWWPLFP